MMRSGGSWRTNYLCRGTRRRWSVEAARHQEIILRAERSLSKTGGEAMARCDQLSARSPGASWSLSAANTANADDDHSGMLGGRRRILSGSSPGAISALRGAFARDEDRIAAVTVARLRDIEQGHALPEPRELTEKHGALLILSEIVMGFRLRYRRAGLLRRHPDPPSLPRISNSMPLSCYLTGVRDGDGARGGLLPSAAASPGPRRGRRLRFTERGCDRATSGRGKAASRGDALASTSAAPATVRALPPCASWSLPRAIRRATPS